jgi:peptidoglycan hydrolase-like protein with peptidoglycan-binding domain
MIKKKTAIFSLILAVMLIISGMLDVITQKPIKVQALTGYVEYPFPGYNMSYNPSYYDPNVRLFQDRLNMIDPMYWCGVADGYFGKQTLTAVDTFQINNGLTVDGVVGRNTWNKIFWVEN